MRLRGFFLLLAVVLAALTASPAAAHTVVPIQPPPGRGGPPEIRLRSLQVQAEVDRGVARVSVDQVFVNQGSGPAEGTYLFPLPQGASVSTFQMFVDGQAYSGEVLDAGKAREIYEGIVRRNRDPALLQYVGQGLLQARIFPVPAGAERRVRIQYSQVLPKESGLSELTVPIGPEAVPQASVTVTLKQPGPTIYSPTHDIAVTREPGGAARVSFESAGARGDFRLLFGGEEDGLGVSLLSYKPSGEDGYFVLLASPPAGAEAQEAVAKDVILAVDLSGSMEGEKFEQAKGAALQVLGSLRADDRFAVIGFQSDVTAYAGGLRPASEAGQAMDWVRGLRVGGATNIAGAMEQMQAMAGRPDGRPQILLLITDGQPTVGEQDPDRIVSGVAGRVTGTQRIFTFGVGYDVNTRLLDAMAQENRGKSDYVKPGENLESAVAALWRKVGQPVLSDLKLDWGGVTAEEVYPRQVPDLYLGSQMVLFGRYRGSGAGSLTITGQVNGRTRSYDFTDLDFTGRASADRDYIPRLWANRKVAYLLSEARLHGSNQELLEEVVALAQRYGIVTPYTSFFINEPTAMPTAPGSGASMPAAPAPMPAAEAARQTGQAMQKAAAAPSGAPAVNASSQMGRMMDASSLAQTEAGDAAAGRIRTAGEKTFLLRQGIWVDTAYQGGPLTQLKLGSDKYLELLRKRPDLARFFAVGTPLVVTDGSTNFAVDYPGAEATPGDLPTSVTAPPAPGGGGGGGNLVSAAGGGAAAAWMGAAFLAAAGGAVFWQLHRRPANKAS